MADRYFSEIPITTGRAVLSGPEAHHLIHVMRARHGSRVVLFDGSGCEFPAAVERVGRAEVELAILSHEEVNRELPRELTLGVALPKGDRQKWLVEKAVELGVTRIVPLETARSVAQPVAGTLARLRRGVIEAAKQCGRNRLMEIAEPQAWPGFLATAAAMPRRLLAHPRGSPAAFHALHRASGAPLPAPTSLAVGPEGGFTDEEVALALSAGWQQIDLGPRILRVETAAIALAAVVSQQLAQAGA